MDFVERLARFDSNRFAQLRPAQTEVLKKLGELIEETSDLGFELPTGAGKTLVALLLADWALDQGYSVAYLTGTTQLADQVAEQAHLLGLDAYRFSSKNYPSTQKRDYDDAQLMGVMSYWTYFNGNPGIAPADFIIFDDAHLAEQALSGLFTCLISRKGAASTTLFSAIVQAILLQAPDGYPTLAAIRDGTAPASTPPELISFVDWTAVEPTVRDLIAKSEWLGDNGWEWRSVENQLSRCGVLIGPSAIEIRPYHLPTQTASYYSRAKHRLYLSATLGQVGDIQRRLGTKPVHIVSNDSDHEPTLGTREFVLNPSGDPALSEKVWNFALQQAENAMRDGAGRVAWLCISHSEADAIQERLLSHGYAVNRLKGTGDRELERWRETPGAHLVTAGRFDGLDFAEDVCRLVILPSVPVGATEFERFVVAYLGDASYMRYRVGQRVTQALGRANRTPTDSALYLGLDPNFAGALADSSVQNALGAQAKVIVNRSLELHDLGWEDTRAAADGFWDNRSAPLKLVSSKPSSRPGRRIRGHAAVNSANDEVLAATSLWLGDGPRAAAHSEIAAVALLAAGELEHSAFWRYVAAQAWAVEGNAKRARESLNSAVEAAPQTAWFVRLRRTIDALEGKLSGLPANDALFLVWDEWVREYPRALGDVAAATVRQESESPAHFETSLRTLARLSGAVYDSYESSVSVSQRWTWATNEGGQRRLWSIHIDAESVGREEIYELRAKVAEEQERHPLSKVAGCLVFLTGETPLTLARALHGEVILIPASALMALAQPLGERFVSYSGISGTGTAIERGEARQQVEARLPDGEWLARLLDPSRPSLDEETVIAEFPR